MDHISIILVHFNVEKDTRECLQSLKKMKAKSFKYKVIIVDNGSKMPFELGPESDPHFEVLRSDSNLGFSGGNNLGIQYALAENNSDYVLLLNNDTTVDPNFLETLFKYAQQHPEAGLINPKIYFTPGREFHLDDYHKADQGNVIWFGGGSIDWNNLASSHRHVDEVDRGHVTEVTQSDFATGCCMLIRREVLESIGGLGEELFLYWEDTEFSLRAKNSGYECHFVPDAVMWHKNAGSTSGSGSKLHRYYQSRNRLFVGTRYGGWHGLWVAVRLASQLVKQGLPEQKAVFDWITGQMGKQPVV